MEPVAINKRESISYRLSFFIGLVIFTAVIASSAWVSWSGFKREIGQQVSFLQGTAKVFSASIAKSVGSGDAVKTKQNLTGISKFPSFKFASVAKLDGTVFTELGFDVTLKTRQVTLNSNDLSSLILRDDIWVEDKIITSGAHVGNLRLLADISQIKAGFFENILFNLGFAFISAIMAVLFSRYLVTTITNPIQQLSILMTKLGQDASYSTRAPENEKGELGLLAKSFNRMLSDIETRDLQLIEYQTSLEEKVEDRTKDLLTAKNVAEQANAAKSEFLATMSHEIRTPMNGMLLMSELLATAELTPKHQRYADVIMKSGKSLLAIINDILDFSKIQSGKMELETIDVDIQLLVEDVMSLFWQKAEEKHLDLACFVAFDVPKTIKADPTRLNQILSNLINNALKFTESGSVVIDVKMDADKFHRAFLNISVRDTGIGIKQENLEQSF